MLEKFQRKNVISLYRVEKLVDRKLAVYPKKTDLLTVRTKCTFDALSDIDVLMSDVFTMKRNISVDIKLLKDIV